MAAIAILHHMPTSQAVEHGTTLVRGSIPPLPSAIIFPDIVQVTSQDCFYSHADWTSCKQLTQLLAPS